jgi:uncharacterized protein YbjQ (UPF0145 family)
MIVTTTSFIPNSEISEIVDVIHSRVVIGTNVFSDISASFSDFFGGNNSAYEKRLAEITEKSIDGLKRKAAKIKANAIIDLKIDVDEISGGNKSMFMVTAIGTAVKLLKSNTHVDAIDRNDLLLKITHNRILNNLSEDTLPITENWFRDYVTQNRIPEVFNILLNHYAKTLLDENSPDEKLLKYISNLEKDEVYDLIISYAKEVDLKKEHYILFNWIFNITEINYTRILKSLKEDDIKLKRITLLALKYYKSTYTIDDFDMLIKISEEIKIQFPKKSKIEIGQSILNRGKEYWICQCGQKNDTSNIYNQYCQKCYLDEYGNNAQTPHIDTLLKFIREIRACRI